MEDIKKIQEFFSKDVNEANNDYFFPFEVKSETPNFKVYHIKYPTGEGTLSIGGKDTSSGQERRKGATQAYMIGQDLLDDMMVQYNLEDFEVTDLDNGTVEVFMVSDEFMDGITEAEYLDESFNSLTKKLDKQKGIDKEEAGKIAGAIAAKKMKGAGKGPTSKQLKRLKEEEGFVEVGEDEIKMHLDQYRNGKIDGDDLANAIEEIVFGRIPSQRLKEEEGYSPQLVSKENPKGKTKGLDSKTMNKILMKVIGDLDELKQLGEGVIEEELCAKGKAYRKKRMAAGEKSSAYLSGRAVKVCKGDMKG